MAITIILAAATMLALALLMGYVLGWANVKFRVFVDPRVTAINEALPGANCGGCGYVGCNEYAEAVVNDGADITLCAPGGSGCAEAIAEIMGVEVGVGIPSRPVVHCAATSNQRLKKREYLGEQTCTAANLVAGVQGCVYGCLGFSDCKDACDYNAIEIIDGLATIIYENCVGCGACVKACPRNIISMVPFKSNKILAVKCASKDFGMEVSKVCEVGCNGCKACAKNSERFTMDGNLPVIDYENYDPENDSMDVVLEKCPRDMLIWVGRDAQ